MFTNIKRYLFITIVTLAIATPFAMQLELPFDDVSTIISAPVSVANNDPGPGGCC